MFGLAAGLLAFFSFDSAYAWGPATHLSFGLTILGQLSQLTDLLRQLLSAQPTAFLYGCVSADIVLAKKLGRAMTHGHKWENGIRLIEETDNPRIKAFAFGYVSHLAADTISHNCYVPSKTIESYDSGILKHMYWELMFDAKVSTPKTVKLFKEIAKGKFDDCDAYFESKIPMRLFDFATNKKIFNHLLTLQGLTQWQKLWKGLAKKNPWPLEDREVRSFSDRSVTAIVSFLNHHRDSEYTKVDPIGQHRLKGAHALRRLFKKRLGTKENPSVMEVRNAVEKFANEPFKRIDVA